MNAGTFSVFGLNHPARTHHLVLGPLYILYPSAFLPPPSLRWFFVICIAFRLVDYAFLVTNLLKPPQGFPNSFIARNHNLCHTGCSPHFQLRMVLYTCFTKLDKKGKTTVYVEKGQGKNPHNIKRDLFEKCALQGSNAMSKNRLDKGHNQCIMRLNLSYFCKEGSLHRRYLQYVRESRCSNCGSKWRHCQHHRCRYYSSAGRGGFGQ